MRALAKAEVLDDALEWASELLIYDYKDPACGVAGVVLETTLKELSTRNNLFLQKLDQMNIALCKAGIYNLSKQKQITVWADLRNKATHGDWNQYNEHDIKSFIEGV